MPSSFAWQQDANGNWDIAFQDGQVLIEDDISSIIKHTILCNGRLSSILQAIRIKRQGYISDLVNTVPSFSIAWFYYIQGSNTNQTRTNIRDAIYVALSSNPRIAQTLQNGGNTSVEVNLISAVQIQILVRVNQTSIVLNV